MARSTKHSISRNGPGTRPSRTDGRWALTGSRDATARLWLTATGKELRRFEVADAVTSVAFSPDGKCILTGSRDAAAKLWTLDGQEVQTFNGHKDVVYSVIFSPDGKYVLTGSRDATVKLWERREVAKKPDKERNSKLRFGFFNKARSQDQRAYSWFCRGTFEPKSEAVRDIQWSKFQEDGK